MNANQLQIISFLQTPKIQFLIPVYQRNYDWTLSECRQLLNDIILEETTKKGTHFIGSLVYIHEGNVLIGDVQKLVIIDGQQRLTTINILLVALYRFAKERENQEVSEMIFNQFLSNQYVKNERHKLKLKQTDPNSRAFHAILNGNEKSYDGFSNVIENYYYFTRSINEGNFDTILNGLERLIFVGISLERGKDDPQRIFESLNSTGLDLSQSDLIRNYILMDLEPEEQERVFETIWNPIEENARDNVKKSSLVSDYIRDYLTLKNKKIPNKSRVYEEFKQLYSNKREDAFYQELENIKSLSFQYKKLVNPGTVSNKKVRKELEHINKLEINVAYPFLLQVFEDEENGVITSEMVVNILQLIQSYVWRRFIMGLPTNALNKVFMTLYAELDPEEYYDSLARALARKKGSAKFPSNEEIKIALKDKDVYNIQSKNRNYFFELLENFQNPEYVDTSNEAITIEHIFPRNPHERWNDTLSPEDYFDFKEKYLNTIGNLTLSGNNGALGNKPFLEKQSMNMEERQQGYVYSRLWLNSYLKEIADWNLDTYKERLGIIYDRFLKIWKFPEVSLEEWQEELEETSIFEAESPTYKKLDYFIFEDTKIEEDAVAQMYFHVIKRLFEKNSALLLNGQDILKISKNYKDFRNPEEVINGKFIEANIDSNSKFGILKKLLKLYEMEDDLMIKYQSGLVNNGEPGRYTIRKKYWQQLLPKLNHTPLFKNVNPTKDHWLNTGAGLTGLLYTLTITKSCARIELGMTSSNKDQNKLYFKKLLSQKEAIESKFGQSLVWEELPDSKMSKIKIEENGLSLFNEDDWESMNSFFIETLPKFYEAMDGFVSRLK